MIDLYNFESSLEIISFMAIFFALTFYHILTCFFYSSLCYKNNNGTDTRAIDFDK